MFEDETGAFPAGTYVRNPPGSSHTPGSTEGCTIFVKLWQFAPDDDLQFRKDMHAEAQRVDDDHSVALLHEDARERVTYTEAAAGAAFEVSEAGGIELLVLDGTLSDERAASWFLAAPARWDALRGRLRAGWGARVDEDGAPGGRGGAGGLSAPPRCAGAGSLLLGGSDTAHTFCGLMEGAPERSAERARHLSTI